LSSPDSKTHQALQVSSVKTYWESLQDSSQSTFSLSLWTPPLLPQKFSESESDGKGQIKLSITEIDRSIDSEREGLRQGERERRMERERIER
jgi:hypothetical protein